MPKFYPTLRKRYLQASTLNPLLVCFFIMVLLALPQWGLARSGGSYRAQLSMLPPGQQLQVKYQPGSQLEQLGSARQLSSQQLLADKGMSPMQAMATITVCASGCNHTTIQAAVNAATAGDVIDVATGTYSEVVTINKSLTLEGANQGISGTGTRSTESELDGTFQVEANNVTIDGFLISGNSFAVVGTGAGPWSNITIQNNRMVGNTGGRAIDYWTQVTTKVGGSNWDILNNYIADIQANDATAITLFDLNDITISGNTILHTNSSFSGRRGMNIDGGQTVTIDNNVIDMGLTAPIQTPPSFPNFTAARYPLQISSSNRSSTNIIVSNNDLGGAYDGIITLGNGIYDDIDIINNVIDDVIFATRFQAGTNSNPGSQSNITIANNIISASRSSVRLQDVDPYTNFNVNNNSLTSTTGSDPILITASGVVFATPGETVDATCNWFGTTDPLAIATQLSGNVNFLPFLTSGADNDGSTPGFQPVPMSCTGQGPVIVYNDDPNTTGMAQNSHFTIQDAVDAAAANDFITVESGTYDEQVLVNKAVTIRGVGVTKPIVDFTGSPSLSSGALTLFEVTSADVTVENIEFKVDISNLGSAVLASGPTTDLVIKDNDINPYRSTTATTTSYGLRNAISINYAGFRVNSANPTFNIEGNTITYNNGIDLIPGTLDDASFRSGLSADEAGGTFTNNTSQTINHDALIRFGSAGVINITNNNLNGGGVQLSDMNAGAGTITVSGNSFDGSFSNTYSNMLRLQNNYNGITTNVSNNTFTNTEWAVSVENYNSVTFDNNTFTPVANSTTFNHLVVNTKSISSNSNSIVQVAIDAALTNNTFNGSGTTGGRAIAFLNHDDDNASFGTFTIGTSGNENTFNADIATFIALDAQTGSSNGATFPTYPTTGGWVTTMAPWDVNLNVENNLFASSPPTLPASMTLAQLYALEDNVFHAMDDVNVGLVTWVPANIYVTTNTLGIQRAVDVASANDQVNVDAGTYAEGNVIVNKALDIRAANFGIVANDPSNRLNSNPARLSASVLDGTFLVQSNNISIDGFDITGNSFAVQAPGTGQSNISIRNNNMYANTGGRTIEYWSSAQPTTDWTISGNRITDVQANNATAITLFNITNLTISNNTILHTNSSFSGRRGMNIDGGQTVTIDNNVIDMGLTAPIQTPPSFPNFTAARYPLQISSSNRSSTNIIVSNNDLGGAYDGIITLGNGIYDDIDIINNVIDDVIFATRFQAGTNSNSGSHSNITIANNIIAASRSSVRLQDVDPYTNFTINNNSLTSTTGSDPILITASGVVFATPGETVDATCNWFGSSDAATVSSSISGDVTAIPYLTNGTDNDGSTPGFQPVPGSCTGQGPVVVYDADPAGSGTIQSSHFAIQAGIDAASAGDWITVAAGTYAENVTVNKSLTILGPNADQDCSTRTAAEAIIAPTSGVPVAITADGVTLNGFEITAPDAYNAVTLSDRSNVTVSYNNIHDIGTNLTGGGNIHAIIDQLGSGSSSNVTISNNCLENLGNSGFSEKSLSAIGILQSTTTGVLTGLNIQDNVINNLNVNTATWPNGKIAYGILINVGGGSGYLTSTGKVVNAVISGNSINDLEGFISTGIGLEGNTENASVTGNTVSNLTGHKLAGRAGGGYDLNGLKFENNRFVGTVTVENNSFEANTFVYGPGPTSNLGYAVANYVPIANGGIAELSCNWFGTATYSELVAEYTTFTGKIFNKEGAGTIFHDYLTNSTIDQNDGNYSCSGTHAGLANLNVNYTPASENVVVTFNTTDNATMIYPIPDLDPTVPADLAAINQKYVDLGVAVASNIPNDIKAAALDLGDDIITEYFYYDNNDPNTGTLVYMQTAGSNDLVKTKYWDQYLNNTSNSDRYPVLPPASPVFEVPIAGLSTSTNPNTGGTVNTGWLGPVYGKDLYVRVTLVHNGNVSIETQSVAIGPAPVVNTNTGNGYPSIQLAIDDPATLSGHTITVAAGTYAENVTVNKSLTILGPNADQDCSTRTAAEAIIAPTSGVPVAITADGVTLNGFEITAPDAYNAVTLSDRSNVTVSYNNIHDIGTNLTGGGNIHAIIDQLGSGSSSNVTISNNCLENLGNSGFSEKSLSAIGILQSTTTGVLTGLNIQDNVINNLNVNTATWPNGKIAYGILINVGGGSGYLTSTGKVVNAVISGNSINDLEGFISTGIGLEGNTENASVTGNTVSNLTGHKLAGRAGGGYDLNGLKFENNRFVGTVTVENNSFEANTFVYGPGPTSNLGYAVANYVPIANGGIAELSCNWFGTATYSELVAEYTTFTGKIFNKEGAGTIFHDYLTNSTIDQNDGNYSCSGTHAGLANLNVNYTPASENVVVTFNTTDNATMIYPIPDLDPTVPADLAAINQKYVDLGVAVASNIPNDIKAAALDLGDDIITEYFYYDNNDPNTGTLVYLQTAGSNDLVKTKYWDQYLNNTSNSDRYPVLPPASPVFEVPIAGLSTSTNPNTGGTVNTGWLGPVYGKDLYVRVTLVHNGNVSIETQSVAIPAPEAICQATTVSLDASGNYTLAASEVDNGSSATTAFTLSVSPNTFDCNSIGTQTVTLTITDSFGNTDECTANVTVEDDLAPTALCQDITVNLDSDGHAVVAPSDIDNNSSDACGLLTGLALASLDFDQDVTPNTIFGSGNANGAFTTNNSGPVEIGIRAKQRFPSPAAVYNSNGDGTYNHPATGGTFGFSCAGCAASWNFDWSINTDPNGSSGDELDDYTYELGIDFDNGDTKFYQTFDLINGDGSTYFDHAIGDNTTGNGGGTVAPSGDVSAYQTLIANNNLAQNSWNLDFFDNAPFDIFNPTDNGRYDIYIAAFDGSGNEVARSSISVIVGTGTGTSNNLITSFDCSSIGTNPNPVVLTVTDNNGNTSSCTGNVTIQDVTNPTATCQNVTVDLDSDGNASIAASDVDDGSSDACGVASLSVTPNTFTCAEVGTENLTLTVTDNNGNQSTCTAVAIVRDVVAPAAFCQDLTVNLDSDGHAVVAPSDIDNNSSDACGLLTGLALASLDFDQDVTPNTIFGSGNANGAFTTNNSGPVEIGIRAKQRFPSPAAIYNSNGDGTYNHPATGGTFGFSCAGCAASWNFDWSINTDPSGSSGDDLNDFTYELGIDFDNGDTKFYQTFDLINGDGSTYFDHAIGDNTTGNGGGTVAASGDVSAYKALIANNNVAQNSWNLDFFDNAPFDIFDPTDNGRYDIYIAAFDGSGNEVARSSISVIVGTGTGTSNNLITSFDCSSIATNPNPVVLTVTDNNGNTSSCNATVTVEDNVPPVAICQDRTVSLDANGNASISNSAVDNGSSDACGIASLATSTTSFTCSNINPPVNVTLTATDNNGNVSTCLATVTVIDDLAPVMDCGETMDIDLLGSGGGGNTVSTTQEITQTFQPVTTGALSRVLVRINPSFTNTNITLSVYAGSDPNSRGAALSTSTTFVASDGTQNVSFDVGIPVTAGSDYSFAITTDKEIDVRRNDGYGNGQLSIGSTGGPFSAIASGNADARFRTRVVPATTVTLDANGQMSLAPSNIDQGSDDNCGITSLSLSPNTFDCDDVANSPVLLTLTASDASGNTASCAAAANVVDNTNPVAICQDITVSLDANGNASISNSAVDNGSNDACGIASLVTSTTSFNCSNINTPVNVTLTATDNNGNVSTCPATVTVIDDLAPVMDCGETMDIDRLGSGGGGNTVSTTQEITQTFQPVTTGALSRVLVRINPTFTNTNISLSVYAGSDPNSRGAALSTSTTFVASVATQSVSFDVGIPVTAGNDYSFAITTDKEINVRRNDGYGNGQLSIGSTGGSFSAIASGNADARFRTRVVPATTVTLDANGQMSLAPSNIDQGSDDNCGITSLGLSPNTFDCDDVANSPVLLTLTASDASGNTASCAAAANVVDDTNPIAICQGVTVSLDANGDASISNSAVDNGSNDACGIASLSVAPSTFTCNEVRDNTVTLTVTDGNGNTSSCNATVTVEDNVPPVMTCNNITLDVGTLTDPTDWIRISPSDIGNATDACGINRLRIPGPGTLRNFDCDDIGVNSRTLEGRDVNGNISTCTANVTVIDGVAPTAVCNDLTVQLDASGSYSIAASDENAIGSGSSDVCGIASLSVGPSTFGCNEVGSNTVTLTVTDNNGNTSTCSATVTVEDNVPPVMTCNNITLDVGTLADPTDWIRISPSDIGNATDACGINRLRIPGPGTLRNFDCDDIGVNSRTLEGRDVNGNISTCTANVTVIDGVAPTAVCNDLTVQLDASGSYSIAASDENAIGNGSSDVCGIASLSVSPSTFGCSDIATNPNEVTLTVTDDNGNTSSCNATVTVEDNVAPVASCQPHTVELNSSGNGTMTAADVDNGSTDACGIQPLAVSQTSFDCSHVGANTVTLTVTDNNGNTSSCTEVVTVEDNVAPVASCQPHTVELNSSGNGTMTAADVDNGSTDACGIQPLAVSQTSFDCSHVGANTVTLTVTDNNGNTSSCTEVVTVEDNVAPVASCQPHTVELNSSGNGTMTAADVDNGSTDACGIQPLSVSQTSFDCSDVGPNTVTLTVTDNNGNVSTCTEVVTVEDNVAPVASCQPHTVELNSSGNGTMTAADVDNGSTDACGIRPLVVSQTSFDCSDVGPNTVTLTVTDNNGNVSTCTEVVTVEDKVAPVASCQPHTVQLNSSGNGTMTAADVDNGSTDACGIRPLVVSQTSFDCSDVGPNTVTLTVTDNNGNVSTCTEVVTVEDNVAPVASCQPHTVQLNSSGNGTMTAADVDNGSTDACGIQPLSVSQTSFDCSDVGPNTVTLTVTDNNGNVSTCTEVVTVEDNVAPVASCQPHTVQLNSSGNGTMTAADVDNGSTDACGIQPLVVSQTSFDCSDVGPNTVTLTVTDNNGNVSTCTEVVTVEDNVAPVASCQPHTVQLNSSGNGTMTAADVDNGSTDACSIQPLSVSQTSFDCSDVGPNTVTLTVTDDNGNVSTCTEVVTVEDNVAPVASCQPHTVQLNSSGNGTMTAADVDNGSTDACGIQPLSVSQTSFDCSDVGPNTVTLTVTDNNGNVSTCTEVVTVEDNVAPVASCQPHTVQLNSSGNGTMTAADVDNGSTDACGIQPLSVSQTSFDCSDVGPNTVTLTVTDNNGNVSTCTKVVTVEDNVAPVARCRNVTVQLNTLGNGSTTAGLVNNGSSDACDVTNLRLSQTSFGCSEVGSNTETLTVTDRNGNTSTCTATVTVEDNVAPVARCRNVTVQLNTLGNGSTTAGLVNNGSSDACDVTNLRLSQTSFGCSEVGSNTETLTVTDRNGNTSTCTATVTVEDNVAPVARCRNVTVQLNTLGNGSTTAGLVNNGSSDACDVTNLRLSQTSFGCSEVGSNTETLTVTDRNGNTSTCTATVTVEDNVAPVARCRNVTVQLDANGNGSTTASAVDNGSNDACGIDDLALSQTSFVCSEVGANAVTLTVTDVNGNTSSCGATVTVEDNVPPVALCQPTTIVLSAIDGTGSITASDVDGGSNDACGIASRSVSPNSFDCSVVGDNTVTLTVTDNNGNTSDCTATVTVDDSQSKPATLAEQSCNGCGQLRIFYCQFDPAPASLNDFIDGTVDQNANFVIGNTLLWYDDNSGSQGGLHQGTGQEPNTPDVSQAPQTLFYWVAQIDQNTGCIGDAIRVRVRVRKTPTPVFNQPTQPFCEGTSLDLASLIDDPNNVADLFEIYDQDPSNVGASPLASLTATNGSVDVGQNYIITPTAGTPTFWVVATNQGNANSITCPATTSMSFVVSAAPVLTPPTNVTACPGEPVNVSFTTSPANAQVIWFNSNTNIGLPAVGLGSISFTAAANTSGQNLSSNISVQASLNGCSSIPQGFTLDIFSDAVLDNSGLTACSSQPTGFTLGTAAGSVAASNYDLIGVSLDPGLSALSGNASPTAGLPANALAADRFQNQTSGALSVTYSIQVRSTDNCLSDVQTVSLSIDPEPVVTSGLATTVCSGQAANLPLSLSNGLSGANFSWTPRALPAGVSLLSTSSPGTTLADVLINNGSSPVDVIFDVTATAGGCTGLAVPCTLTVVPFPATPPTAALSACEDPNNPGQASFDLSSLDASIGGGQAVSYFADPNLTQPISSPAAYLSGNATVYAAVSGAGICPNRTDVSLTVISIAAPQVSGQLIACGDEPQDVVPTPVSGISFNFYDGDPNNGGQLLSSGASYDPQVTPGNSLSLWITATDGTCEGPAVSISVTVNPAPTADASALLSNNSICENDTLELYGAGGGSYSWIGPNGFTSSQQNPVILPVAPEDSGDYILTVMNAFGCTDKDTVNVKVDTLLDAGLNGTLTIAANALPEDLFDYLGGTPVSGGVWAGPRAPYGGDRGTFNPAWMPSGLYTYTLTNPEGCSDSVTIATVTVNVTPVNAPKLQAKIFLEGPLDTTTLLMGDGLRVNNFLQTAEPYTGDGYTHLNGGGNENFKLGLLDSTGNDALVDWVYIELRDPNDSTVVLATRSALLQRDGDIVELDGQSPVCFNRLAVGYYYVVIGHRNHCAVMTAMPVFIDNSGTVSLDFTNAMPPVFGVEPQILTATSLVSGGVYVMIGGDADGNGQVQNTDDVNFWQPFVGGSGYLRADYDLSGQVQNSDKVKIWGKNVGNGTQVPQRSN